MFIDSDILIDFTNGHATAVDWLDNSSKKEVLRISMVVAIELLVGSLNKKHMKEILELFERFELIHTNEQISQKAYGLIQEYFLSHGLLVADAMIAATALVLNDELATKNKRDFRYIEGLRLVDYL